jgi:hypothetical protein
MKALLTIAALVLCSLIIVVVPLVAAPVDLKNLPLELTVFDYAKAVVLFLVLAVIAGYMTYRQEYDAPFLLRLFVAAVLVRVAVGTLIYAYNGQGFFGGDALTYDYWGQMQAKAFLGDQYSEAKMIEYLGPSFASGWGMPYLVAFIYLILGRNFLGVQLVNCVIGAATVPIIFNCAHHLFNNLKVSRFSALAVAFYPSLVLWSCQGLKDGPIVFLLALSILATLKLSERLQIKYIAILAAALLMLLSFRFYIFYMLAVAVGGTLLVGTRPFTTKNFAKQMTVMIIIGLVFTYFGVSRITSAQIGQYGNLATVQEARSDLTSRAESGFGRDLDVSTPEGVLLTIPVGLVYLIFAPFPWQLTSLRQSITLPEMIIWWACFPLLVLGIWFSIKYRLRQIFPVLIFTVMLSVAYSVFQGNVGTAYRQRAQLLVFYFIFVAVGYVLLQERREEKARQLAQQRELATTANVSRALRHPSSGN